MKIYIRIVQWLLNKNIWVPDIFMYFFERFSWHSNKNLKIAILGLTPVVLSRLSRAKLLWVFNDAYSKTPALQKFYLKNNLSLKKLGSVDEFQRHIPITTKENYINSYKLEERCINGKLPINGIIFKSAGVAGERTYWTQSLKEEERFSVFVPFGLEYIFQYTKKNYNLLNCWAFGTWPTAIDFTKAARECGRMINIGPNIDETISTIKKLGNKNNYLISGYPPYLKNLLIEGERNGINWNEYRIDVLTGGEGFVEEWRDLLVQKLGNKSIIVSAYGSTDKGLGEGIETPLSITVRNIMRVLQISLNNPKKAEQIYFKKFHRKGMPILSKERIIDLFQKTFKQNLEVDVRLPMLFQTDPLTYFHEEKNILIDNSKVSRTEVITTNLKTYASQPVIRYNIGDESGVISHEKVLEIFNTHSIDIVELSNNIPHSEKKPLPYPFFFVYGRSDGMISIDGVNIFPDEIGRMIENLQDAEKINSFRIFITQQFKIGIEIEMKQMESIDKNSLLTKIKDTLVNFSSGFKTLVNEGLASSEIELKIHHFGEGPFIKSPLVNPYIIKYQYIGSKIFGHH